MGRIRAEGFILVDLEETMKLLNISRPTVFRLIKGSELIKIEVGGFQQLYVTLESVERYKNKGPQFRLERRRRKRAKKKHQIELSKQSPSINPYLPVPKI